VTGPTGLARIVIAMAACVAFASCAHRVDTGRVAVWQLRGAIVDVDHGRLRIRHKSGQIVELLIDDNTVLLRGARHESPTALRPGRRVVVDVEPLGGGGQRARRVRLFGGA
jgi:hypothetical protein